MALAPLPGDAGVVRKHAVDLVEAADKMNAAARTLRNIAGEIGFKGQSVEALHDNALEMETVLHRAEIRYREAGNALIQYSTSLDAAQQQANQAIAIANNTNVWGARANVLRLQGEGVNPFRSEAERMDHDAELRRAEAELEEQRAREEHATRLYREADEDLDRAAKVAMAAIDAGNERSGLNDSFWDDLNGFYDEYLGAILNVVVRVLDTVSEILASAAGIVALFGAPHLALALMGLAIATKGVSVLAKGVQALAGERRWGSVLTDGIKTAAIAVTALGRGRQAIGKAAFGVVKLGKTVIDAVGVGKAVFDVTGAAKTAVSHTDYELSPVQELVLSPVDYVVESAAGGAGDLYDSVVEPESVWTVRDLATPDISSPIGTDFSGVDVDEIIAGSIPETGSAAVIQCTEQSASAGAGGSGR